MAKIKWLGVALVAGITPWMSSACDMHGGFGFSPLGTNHGSFTATQAPQPVANITLIHLPKLRVAAGQESKLQIRYQAMFRFSDIKLTYSASENVTLLDDTSSELPAGSGRRGMTFIADAPGEHEITLTVSAMEYDKPIEITRKVKVIARES